MYMTIDQPNRDAYIHTYIQKREIKSGINVHSWLNNFIFPHFDSGDAIDNFYLCISIGTPRRKKQYTQVRFGHHHHHQPNASPDLVLCVNADGKVRINNKAGRDIYASFILFDIHYLLAMIFHTSCFRSDIVDDNFSSLCQHDNTYIYILKSEKQVC